MSEDAMDGALSSQASQLRSLQEQFERSAAQKLQQALDIKGDMDKLSQQLITQEGVGSSTGVILSDPNNPFPSGLITVKIGEAVVDGNYENGRFTPSGPIQNPISDDNPDSDPQLTQDVNKGEFIVIQPGSRISLLSNFPIIYVVNIIPSEILEVIGRRSDILTGIPPGPFSPFSYGATGDSVALQPRLEEMQLVGYEVGSVELVDTSNETIAYDVTIITLNRALSTFSPDWSDDLYASFTSSVGPNTVDIITWLIQKYTHFAIDGFSFSYCRAKVARFPSNFVLMERKDILTVLQEITYQARLSIKLSNGVFYLRYLPEAPTPVTTITENDVEVGSLELSYTPTEDLVTKSVSNFAYNYIDLEPSKCILRYNINKYGTIEQTYDYYIYNIPSTVSLNSTFWLIRNANTWKKLKFNCFLNKLNVETLDYVLLDFNNDYVCNGPVIARVDAANYDSANNVIQMDLWVPVRMGEMSPYPFAFTSGVSKYFFFPTNEEIANGAVTQANSNVSDPENGLGMGGPITLGDQESDLALVPMSQPPPNVSDEQPQQKIPDNQGGVTVSPYIPGVAPLGATVTLSEGKIDKSKLKIGQPITIGGNSGTIISLSSAPGLDGNLFTQVGMDPPPAMEIPAGTAAMMGLTKGTFGPMKSNAQPYAYRSYTLPPPSDPPKPVYKCVPVQIIGGTADSYSANAYNYGFAGPATVVTVSVLQIDPSETIPPGTWLIAAVIDGAYYVQPPVWLSQPATSGIV